MRDTVFCFAAVFLQRFGGKHYLVTQYRVPVSCIRSATRDGTMRRKKGTRERGGRCSVCGCPDSSHVRTINSDCSIEMCIHVKREKCSNACNCRVQSSSACLVLTDTNNAREKRGPCLLADREKCGGAMLHRDILGSTNSDSYRVFDCWLRVTHCHILIYTSNHFWDHSFVLVVNDL